MTSFFDDSTSANSSPYESLLDQVTALQSDLSKTFAVCQTLRAENEQLGESLTSVKEENGKLREKYTDVRKRYYDENQQKTDIENKHEEIVRSWKIQLEQKAGEFEKLQSKLAPPRDLDLLRMKIQEELEVPHQQKVGRLNAEVEKYREMFYNVRREHELLKTEFEQFTIDQGKREEAAHAATSAMVKGLKAKIENLQTSRDDTTLKDRVRLMGRDLKEYQIREEQMKNEISGLTKQKQEAVVEMERAILSSQKHTSELAASAQTMEARALTAESNVHNFKTQYERAQRRVNDQQKRVVELEGDLSRHRHMLEKKDQHIADEQATASDSVQKISQDCDAKIARVQAESLRLEREITKLQQALQTANAKTESAKRVAEENATSIRREIEDLNAHFQTEREELEQKVENAQALVKEANEGKAEALSRSQADHDAVKKIQKKLEQEITRREKEAEGWKQERSRFSEAEHERDDAQNELRDEYGTLQAQHREIRAKEQALLTEREKLESNVEYLENEVAKMSSDQERSREMHVADLEQQRIQFLSEFKNLKREMKNQDQKHRKLVSGLNNDIKKVKAKSEEYKKKALSEHRKFGQVKQEFNSTRAQFEATKRELQVELNNASQRIREVERSRDLLMIGGNGENDDGGVNSSGFDSVSQDEKEHQKELAKYLERLEKM
jgi:coiled-coil domain-containing protein 41